MAGIAGVASPGKRNAVDQMLEKLTHRGSNTLTLEAQDSTLGVVYNQLPSETIERLKIEKIAIDSAGGDHFARVDHGKLGLVLSRDRLGVAPLYYGQDAEGDLCFASEVKGLIPLTRDVHELLPGHRLINGRQETLFSLQTLPASNTPPDQIAREVRLRLNSAVERRAKSQPEFGCLLSGGLDSSAIAALARPYSAKMHTFAAGVAGAPDLKHARDASEALNTYHHERLVRFEDMLNALPDVIYHLESFDALLVRSSITHYLVAQMAANIVPAVFSGEGGDELFAGYSYLKQLSLDDLPNELIDITNRLHNTALQRVDRCTLAHGVTAWVPFLDANVVDYVVTIPPQYKLKQGVEKWILREAVRDLLPSNIVTRPKAKFWEGAGVGEQMLHYADKMVSNQDFQRERQLPNGWKLNSKEELLYYRIFKEHFGDLDNLAWMGRTKGAPVH